MRGAKVQPFFKNTKPFPKKSPKQVIFTLFSRLFITRKESFRRYACGREGCSGLKEVKDGIYS